VHLNIPGHQNGVRTEHFDIGWEVSNHRLDSSTLPVANITDDTIPEGPSERMHPVQASYATSHIFTGSMKGSSCLYSTTASSHPGSFEFEQSRRRISEKVRRHHVM
jgi:hypothetical protein